MSDKIQKVSIIVSKGSLDGVYPGLIMANGARMEGIEVNLFFTFFGMDAVVKKRMNKIKIATVGNPGMHMPSLLGIVPGFSGMATKMMMKTMDKLDIPPVPEFVEMISDAGAKLYACKMSVDMMGLTMDDFVDGVQDIVTASDFMDMTEGSQIIFI